MDNSRLKFRVWLNKENKYDEDCFLFRTVLDMNGKCFVNEDGGCDIEMEEGGYTTEQCTGLKDKNGKLIYEGDVIKCRMETLEVIFDNNTASFRIILYKSKYRSAKNGFLPEDLKDMEIIGNIHEQKGEE